jgi:hypothetical protein
MMIFAPALNVKEAQILCANSNSPVAVVADMDACMRETRRVPEWKFCACLRPPNEWSLRYWRFAVPGVLVVLGVLFLGGSVLAQLFSLAGSIAVGGAVAVAYQRATDSIDNEGVFFSVLGLGYLIGLVLLCLAVVRGMQHGWPKLRAR